MPAQSTANYRILSQFKINLLKKKRKGSKKGGGENISRFKTVHTPLPAKGQEDEPDR